jgi:hypothetical protein
MSHDAHICDKCTEPVLDWLRTARDNDQIEVIVRLKDTHALERPSNRVAKRAEAVQREKLRARPIVDNFVESLSQLEDGNADIRLLDTSWLTHSALVVASPQGVKMLSGRDDVDLIDVNATLRKNFSGLRAAFPLQGGP